MAEVVASGNDKGMTAWVRYFWREYNLYVVLAALVAISAFLSDDFLTVRNISNLLLRCSFNGLISLGMTFVILVAGIDLSVGALFAFAGVFLSTMLHGAFFKFMPGVNQAFEAGGALNPILPLWSMILLTLLAGAFFGLTRISNPSIIGRAKAGLRHHPMGDNP